MLVNDVGSVSLDPEILNQDACILYLVKLFLTGQKT